MAEDVVADQVNSSRLLPSWFQVTRDWAKRDPLAAALLLTIIATLVYFFGFVKLFTNGSLSTWIWAWQAWNPETNYEHAKIIPLITVFLVWHARNKLKVAPISSSRWGWLFVGVGLFLFIAGARTLQARLALTSLPFLLFGVVLYVWGRHVARIPNEKDRDEWNNFGVLVVGFRIPRLPRPNPGREASICKKFCEAEKINQCCNDREKKRSRQWIALRPIACDLEPARQQS